MTEIEQSLRFVPDIELDLTGCDEIASHGLPPPVVITLARRPDRWQSALRNLRDRGIENVIRATAIDGQTMAEEVVDKLLADPAAVASTPSHYLQMTRPAVGCFLSHLAIWKQFLQTGAQQILILEDDAVPARGYDAGLARATMERVPANADLVMIGCTIMDGLAEPTTDPAFLRVYYYNGTYGYLLRRRGCLALLPRLLPIKTHIDNQISLELVQDHGALHAYCTEPRLIEHDFTVYSDVYIAVSNVERADRALDAIFKESRQSLLRAGARLLPMHSS